MSSAENLKVLVRDRLAAAADEILSAFYGVIVDFEKELEQHRKLLDAVLKPVVKLHRAELPQQLVCKEEVTVGDQPPLNQDKNSSLDEEESESRQFQEQQEDESGLGLPMKQESEGLQICSAEQQSNKSDDQIVDWPSGESGVKIVVITSLMPETTNDLQQLSLSAGVSPSRAEKDGEQEFESEILIQRHVDNNQCVFKTGGRGFSRPGTSLERKLNNSAKKCYACLDCGRGFSVKSNLTRHKRTHTGEKPFVCQTCAKRFSSAHYLKIHKMIHTGEKPFACDKCGKRFKRQTDLRAHSKIHTGEKPHVCGTCGKCFLRQIELTIHNRTHTGEKPYVCQTCGRSFSRKLSLEEHKRIHTGEKPYVCKECGKGFVRSTSLGNHVRSAHGSQRSLPNEHA